MHPAARLQFERMIGEYARWRAVPEKERSPAPAWWWGPAMELRNYAAIPAGRMVRRARTARSTRPMLQARQSCSAPSRARRRLPWPYDFPRKAEIPDPTVRELHPQPSDDSAFQP